MKRLWKYLRTNWLNRDMFLPFCLGELTYWCPYFVLIPIACINPTFWAVVASFYTVYTLITPAIVVQATLIIFYKKVINRIRSKHDYN
jgi:hypothetical protein